jgi:hypothetical protein
MPFNKFIKRDFPHIVEIVVPSRRNRRKWDAMIRFHACQNVQPHRNHGRYKDGCLYARWYFADSELAEAFAAKFAKEGRKSRYKRHARPEKSEKRFRTLLKPMCREEGLASDWMLCTNSTLVAVCGPSTQPDATMKMAVITSAGALLILH